jgi:hypothetical protein
VSPGDLTGTSLADPDPRLGDQSQVISTRAIRLGDGGEDGVRAIDVRVSGGLSALVLPDRGLDLGPAWVAGWQVSWQSTTGIVHPAQFDEGNWLRSFPGGLLTTCGLQNVGEANTDEGVAYGLHGRISNIQARRVSHGTSTIDGRLVAEVAGEVRETDVYGADLILHRRLRFPMESPVVEIHDEVENHGFAPAAFQLLYHINVGWPVVASTSRLYGPPADVVGRDERSAELQHEHDTFSAPTQGFPALVYEHRLHEAAAERATVSIVNPDFGPTSGIGLSVTFHPRQLPRLWQWRMLAPGMYLTGIEPANCSIFGRAADRAASALPILEPGERRASVVTIAVATGSAIDNLVGNQRGAENAQ